MAARKLALVGAERLTVEAKYIYIYISKAGNETKQIPKLQQRTNMHAIRCRADARIMQQVSVRERFECLLTFNHLHPG